MSDKKGLNAMMEDGNEMVALATKLLSMSQRMVAYAKNMQGDEDDEETPEGMEEEEESTGKNKAKEMALLAIKKKRK